MRIKKKNVARLASLSALGAGALGVAAGTAEAGVIWVPDHVTVGPGHLPSVTINLPGSHSVYLGPGNVAWVPGASFKVLSDFFPATTHFKESERSVRVNGFGVQFMITGDSNLGVWHARPRWSTASSRPGTWALIARRSWGTIGSFTGGHSTFHHEYALFEFQSGGVPVYGWMDLSNWVSTSSLLPDPPPGGPDVTIWGYGYEENSTPEPSTTALSGLAALALGATGLRRWRAARKNAA
jgi:hypothetical protein